MKQGSFHLAIECFPFEFINVDAVITYSSKLFWLKFFNVRLEHKQRVNASDAVGFDEGWEDVHWENWKT